MEGRALRGVDARAPQKGRALGDAFGVRLKVLLTAVTALAWCRPRFCRGRTYDLGAFCLPGDDGLGAGLVKGAFDAVQTQRGLPPPRHQQLLLGRVQRRVANPHHPHLFLVPGGGV